MTSKGVMKFDKKQQEQEWLQGLLVGLLRVEENKFCADCEAKQPRWASWNLGVFICIRCAGIHRNLGTHISKVKSVTLDTWTKDQVQSMRVIGNGKAKYAYENELPEAFRRPTSDQALEAFIRAKYEQKRYGAREWKPPVIDPSELPPIGSKRTNVTSAASPGQAATKASTKHTPQKSPHGNGAHVVRHVPTVSAQNPEPQTTGELLDFSSGDNLNASNQCADADDMFGPLQSAPPPLAASSPNLASHLSPNKEENQNEGSVSGLSDDLLGLSFNSQPAVETNTKRTNQDIMSLFASAPSQVAPQSLHGSHSQGSLIKPLLPQATNTFGQCQPTSQTPMFYGCSQTINQPPASGQPLFANFGTNLFPSMPSPAFASPDTAAAFAAASPFANTSMNIPPFASFPNVPSHKHQSQNSSFNMDSIF